MLLHQLFCDRYGAYRALETAYKEGKLRAIGVSNFYPDHFIDLASNVEIVPAVNQVETHVFDQQTEELPPACIFQAERPANSKTHGSV